MNTKMIVEKILKAAVFACAVFLWTIGELGTLGAFVPNNHGWASFHGMFLIPWAASVVLIILFVRKTA